MINWLFGICLFFGACAHPEVLSDFVIQLSPTPTPQKETITLLATGDVLLARSVNTQMIKRNDFFWPFAETADFLRNADLTIINLETPLLDTCLPTDTGMIFCGDRRAAAGLVYAGIDFATIANNHSDNYGKQGIEETKKILLDNEIIPVDNDVKIKEVKGTKFAFLSYNAVSPLNEVKVKGDIVKASEMADVIIVSMHWGEEYTSTPSADQVRLAHNTVDWGADLIIGNHPHWIQPMEIYKDTVIMYSHGNFIFDQEWSEETKTGVVGKYTFVDKKLTNTEFIPIKIRDFGQAYFPDKEQSDRILNNFNYISEKQL